jgi:DNA polymerase III epsilon subunit-like protein
VPAPVAYAVFDCETTGTTPERDEIVALAVVRLDADGVETRRVRKLVPALRPWPSG